MATHSTIPAWESQGWRNLVGYSPWGRKESDTTKWLHFIRNQSSIYFSVKRSKWKGREVSWREGKCLEGAKGAPVSAGQVLFRNLSHGYILWWFINQYTYGLCSFLFIILCKGKKKSLPFQFYKDQAISYHSHSATMFPRGIHHAEKQKCSVLCMLLF